MAPGEVEVHRDAVACQFGHRKRRPAGWPVGLLDEGLQRVKRDGWSGQHVLLVGGDQVLVGVIRALMGRVLGGRMST